MLNDTTNQDQVMQRQVKNFSYDELANQQFLDRLSTIYPKSSLIMKQTSFSDGRVEKSITIKPITAIEKTQQFLIFMLLIMIIICISLVIHQTVYDVQAERDIQLIKAQIEIQQCKEDFIINLCDPNNRIPSTENYCLLKEQCMNQNALNLARSNSNIMQLIGKNIDSLFIQLSNKTALFLLVFIIMITVIILQVIKQNI